MPPPTDPGSTGPGSTGPGSTGPGSTGPGSTGPGSTGPGSTGAGSTGAGSEGMKPPRMVAPLATGRNHALVDRLSKLESPAFTARRARRSEASGADQDPIVWQSALGVNVVDVNGNRFVDFTAGFGVAAVGHAHPDVQKAIREQSEVLIHGLGDVHPSEKKIELLERLNHLVPGPTRTALSVTGSDAVATALKTAALATKKTSVIAFEGAYHGLAYGPLSVCGYQPAFRSPFQAQLNQEVRFLPYPSGAEQDGELFEILAEDPPGAVIIEPMLGRGGIRPLPDGYLARLGQACKRAGTLLIVDEIFTGLGRTGSRLMSVDMGADPDLICLGKALGGGLPISACIGRESVMRAWGDPQGEALHTGTFFGHPLSCAAALATLQILEGGLIDRAGVLGAYFCEVLERECSLPVRGCGLALAVELPSSETMFQTLRALLERGYIALPAGNSAIALTPPFTITRERLDEFAKTLAEILHE